ncbi:hypothetical protein J2X31_002882 [Flavobacterium arsenatis]|uniref:Lipoprotein n=1 Tax=Flavobacterium arsenatis TaxID=1484332 RepID=A0ABU1TSN6_9FLAO|nr:hypothetical protein [Flavobacterium arsenatis]MDR6968856.1 hypothetical protein [Flavobacterium arsenatis]
MKSNFTFLLALLSFATNCFSKNDPKLDITTTNNYENTSKVIHVFVALCDNKYQGIVPVPAKIGDGQDADNNLYWGCGFGIRTYFKKSSEWKFLKSEKMKGTVLERVIFKHTTKDVYLIADAYDGKEIKKCTEDFLNSNSGDLKNTIKINDKTLGIYGNSALVAYIGHNGLMDFKLNKSYTNTDGKKRDCIILACKSKSYFSAYITNANSNPLVWTTQFMAPEAYTIHDAISGYVLNENANQIRERAAKAYSKFQKCSLKAAKGLLVAGF